METDYERAHPESVLLAFRALEALDGHSADLVLPAIIVLVSEIVSQVSSDSREVAKIMQAITDSVFINCTQIEKNTSEVH